MRSLGAIALVILAGLAIYALLRHTPDLRGWPSTDPLDERAVLTATTPQGQDFSRDACLSGSVDEFALPSLEEYSGTATLSVVACRSKSSTALWLGLYGLVSTVGLVAWGARRRGKPAKSHAST